MARDRHPAIVWPAWFHAPNGDSAIFQLQEDVPEGWSRKRQSAYEAPTPLAVDKEATLARLMKLGVLIDPRWGSAQLKKVLDEND